MHSFQESFTAQADWAWTSSIREQEKAELMTYRSAEKVTGFDKETTG